MNGTHHGRCKAWAATSLAGLALFAAGAAPSATAADAPRFEDPAAIRGAAETAVRDRLASVQGRVTADAEALDPRLLMPACDAPLEANLPARAQDSARVTAEVQCTGTRAWRLFVPVRVTIQRPVVVTTQPLERGKVLAPGDVILADQEVSGLAGGYLTAPGMAVGRILRRSVPAGAALSPVLLDSPVLIRRGQTITLEARTGALTVRAPGVARGDGALGQMIEVQNVSSRKILQAIVKNERSAEIPVP